MCHNKLQPAKVANEWRNIPLPHYRYGATAQEAGAKFFILDEHGLITKARPNLKEMEENFYDLVSDVTQIQ